jgi:hypothetical protein
MQININIHANKYMGKGDLLNPHFMNPPPKHTPTDSVDINKAPKINGSTSTTKSNDAEISNWSTHAQLDKLTKTILSNHPPSIREEFETLLDIYPTSVRYHHFINKIVIFSPFYGFHIVVGNLLKLEQEQK